MLVPSVMEVLGRRSWWLPGFLDRVIPRVNVEGTGVFDEEVEAPTPAILS
jgi:RND superfamily putative drug exporter